MTPLIALLINILIVVLLLALIYWVLGMFPLPQRVRSIIMVLLVVVAILYFLTGHHVIRID